MPNLKSAMKLMLAIMTCSTLSTVAIPQENRLTTLAAQRDNTRPLLIFAEHPDDPQMAIQLRILDEHAAEAADRQVVPIALAFRAPGPSALQLSADDAEAARRKFHVGSGDFVVILLGKDGGAKLRSPRPIPMSKLEETIDAMPMRKDEMRSDK